MKKTYTIILLLLMLIFLSTYSDRSVDLNSKEKKSLFTIKNIEVINNSLISKDMLRNKLKILYEKNIFLLKKKDIEERINKINFLERIEVKKKYPNAVIIKVFETEPVAIFFKNKTKFILDSRSNLISLEESININLKELPTVFGDGGDKKFIYFFNLLKKNRFPTETVKGFYYFQIGRWNLKLFDDKIIKFPSQHTTEAIIKSIDLMNNKNFKNYNIIDLRIDGKIIVER